MLDAHRTGLIGEAADRAGPRAACRLSRAVPGSLAIVLAAVAAAVALGGFGGAARAAECSIAQKDRGAILKAIERASSCESAREILQACASSTSGDVALSNAVVAKCEKLFKAQLSPVDRAEYERQKKACATRAAVERGTESVSLAARCKAGVAADFAK